MSQYSLYTPEDLAAQLAQKIRDLRLNRQWKQATLAERAGVSLGSLRRFEQTGQTSLNNLLKLAFALHRLDDFVDVLNPPPARSIKELVNQNTATSPKRGRV